MKNVVPSVSCFIVQSLSYDELQSEDKINQNNEEDVKEEIIDDADADRMDLLDDKVDERGNDEAGGDGSDFQR